MRIVVVAIKQKSENGSIKDRMVSAVPALSADTTIADIEKLILEKAGTFDTLDYVYITDRQKKLEGVISIREVFDTSDKNKKAAEVMKKNLVVARISTAQERVVYLALLHGIKSVPVVDKAGILLGVVPYNAILEIFNHEVREDSFKFGGIFHKIGKEITTVTSPVPVMIKARVPWLIIGVIGGAVAASIVSGFEEVLSSYLMLAAFIPVLVYLSDAAGTQSETLIVRGLAVDPKLQIKKYLIREFTIACILGVICGLLMGAVAALGWGLPVLGLIVGTSMFLSVLAAVFISTVLPLVFMRFNADPAVASGPFATLISDIATIVIYFQIATMLLDYFGLA